MKKQFVFPTATVLAILLAACGGSGGGGSTTAAAPTNQPTNPTNPTNPTTPSTSTNPSTGTVEWMPAGKYLAYIGTDAWYGIHEATVTASGNKRTIANLKNFFPNGSNDPRSYVITGSNNWGNIQYQQILNGKTTNLYGFSANHGYKQLICHDKNDTTNATKVIYDNKIQYTIVTTDEMLQLKRKFKLRTCADNSNFTLEFVLGKKNSFWGDVVHIVKEQAGQPKKTYKIHRVWGSAARDPQDVTYQLRNLDDTLAGALQFYKVKIGNQEQLMLDFAIYTQNMSKIIHSIEIP